MSKRLESKFAYLKKHNRSALITYIMAYDTDYESSLKMLKGLPEAGADIIELGIPFSDPMADGPIIQKAAIRALKSGAKIAGILDMIEDFRKNNDETPIVLMGYYNPICHYGVQKFATDAATKGADALLIVDVPPEEDSELYAATKKAGIDLIKLATPTTDDARLKIILNHAKGFLYYVAVAGVTGTKSAAYGTVGDAVSRIKKHTDLPVAVGFGIKTKDDVAAVGKHADAVVVGSSLVDKIDNEGVAKSLQFVKELTGGI